jgi:hypothetical protein
MPLVVVLAGGITTGAELPPTIDGIIKLPPITLRTRGLSPQQAVEALSKETGVAIYPFRRAVPEGKSLSPKSPVFDLWTARQYRPIDFDLESVSFWPAMRRIAVHANIGIRNGGRDVVLYEQLESNELPAPGVLSETPLTVGHLIPAEGGPAFTVDLYVDPRVPLLSAGPVVIERAMAERGRSINASAQRGLHRQFRDRWRIHDYVQYTLPDQPAARIVLLSGYAPVMVVTRSQTVEFPLDQLGFAVEIGPWVVKLEDFRSSHFVGGNAVRDFFIGFERRQPSSVPVPPVLGVLAQLVDANGRAMIVTGDSRPQTTVSGGIREWVEFECALRDGAPATPAKLLVDVPLEIKSAIVPFEFRDIPMPRAGGDR